MRRGGLEHVPERGDEGVDAAAEVLEVHEDDVEGPHRLARGSPHLAVKAEHRHAVDRIGEIGCLHHVVLLVAAHAVLRAEGGGELDVRQGGQGVERMDESGGE